MNGQVKNVNTFVLTMTEQQIYLIMISYEHVFHHLIMKDIKVTVEESFLQSKGKAKLQSLEDMNFKFKKFKTVVIKRLIMLLQQ